MSDLDGNLEDCAQESGAHGGFVSGGYRERNLPPAWRPPIDEVSPKSVFRDADGDLWVALDRDGLRWIAATAATAKERARARMLTVSWTGVVLSILVVGVPVLTGVIRVDFGPVGFVSPLAVWILLLIATTWIAVNSSLRAEEMVVLPENGEAADV